MSHWKQWHQVVSIRASTEIGTFILCSDVLSLLSSHFNANFHYQTQHPHVFAELIVLYGSDT